MSSLAGILRRALVAAAVGPLVALACSTPDYHFVPDQQRDHCNNQAEDSDLGESDLDCGGADCRGCNLGQRCLESSDCADGDCLLGHCLERGCENGALDGEETEVDCGGGCAGCRDGQPCLGPADCQSSVCENGTCASPTCQDHVRNGAEFDEDCGGPFCDGCGVGSPCKEAADCQSGACDPNSETCALNCKRGTDECDGDEQEPCETNLLKSVENCGACGNACDLPHAEASCTGGECQIQTCVAPWLRCNTDDDDGCEINGSSDPKNCGGCGMECPSLHGEPACADSECVIECDDGFGDCDEDARNGCEASVADVDNCGGCGKKCPSSDGEPFCLEGRCGLTRCEDGKGDCDGDQDCESDLGDDPENCGRCGRVCGAANGSAECVAGRCVIAECDDGWENCDDDQEDGGYSSGCEANFASDARNCGSCGERCDLAEHGTGTCQSGTCVVACDGAFEDCDGSFANGCEVDTTADADHCGGCDNGCDIANAVAKCVDSTCAIDRCVASYDDCNAAEGCETNVSNSAGHCGSCAGNCSNAGATEVSCSDGQCDAPTCDDTHDNCDGNDANGCETDLTTAAACGTCDNACESPTPNCVASGDTYRCQAQIVLVNAAPYPTAQATASGLTFKYRPRAGNNRLVLVAITAESKNNGIAGARPDAVRFGSTGMTAGPSQAGVVEWWSPDLFVYYLALGSATSDGAEVDVTIDGSAPPAMEGMFVQLLQLNGVRQNAPITASLGAYSGDPDTPDPATISVALPVANSGSVIYSFGGTMWMFEGSCPPGTPPPGCPSWAVNPSTNLTVIQTMSTTTAYIGGTPTRAFGMYAGSPAPSLPAAGTYNPSWTLSNSGRMTHLALVIAPASS